MKVKYKIIFEEEIEVPDGSDDSKIRDEIARDFYENDYDAFDATHLSWEEVE